MCLKEGKPRAEKSFAFKYMLKAGNRLKKQKDIETVFKGAKPYFSKCFTLRALPSQLGTSRITIVVSNKISKKATARNRLKMQAREVFRLNLAKIKTGFDIILQAKLGSLGLKYQEIDKEVLFLLNLAKLLKK